MGKIKIKRNSAGDLVASAIVQTALGQKHINAKVEGKERLKTEQALQWNQVVKLLLDEKKSAQDMASERGRSK